MRNFYFFRFLALFLFLLHTASAQAEASQKSNPSDRSRLSDSIERFKILLDGDPIGYSIARTEKLASGFRFSETGEIAIRTFGKPERMKTSVAVETDADTVIQSFVYDVSTTESALKAVGRVKKGVVETDLTLNDLSFKANTKWDAGKIKQSDIVLTPLVLPRLIHRGIPKTRRWVGQLYDPESMTFHSVDVAIVKNPSKRYAVTATWLGEKFVSELSVDFKVLESTMYIGRQKLVTVPATETEEKLVALLTPFPAKALDIISASSIVLREPIRNREQLGSLTLTLGGVNLNVFQLANHRQTFLPKTKQVKITRESPPAQPATIASIDRAQFAEHLKDARYLSISDPTILATAKRVVGGETDAWSAARKIMDFVHSHLKREPVAAAPHAPLVLKMKKGDCNEHTVLFVALARAAGIPAKIHAGLTYTELPDLGPRYLYHAWPSVFVGEWVSMDPTWNQTIADVTHLSLVEGGFEEQINLIQAIGKITVRDIQTTEMKTKSL